MVCCRKEQQAGLNKKIELLSDKLIPENIKSAETKIIKNNSITFGIFNFNDSVTIKEDRSVCLGSIFDSVDWQEPLKNIPDGSYALFRSNDEYVEVLSDGTATITVWYFKDENVFIASTSQRAVIFLTGSFIFNEKIIPWMLSAGNLGPGFSWDKRIKCLGPDSALLLNRLSWTISCKENKPDFTSLNVPDSRHYELMKEAVENTLASMKMDYSRWVIPLSGGYDSRYLLSLLKDRQGISTVTWGSRQFRNQKGNDAYIARMVAEKYGVKNSYFELDLHTGNIEKIFNYFLNCGEGRIDHLSGYTDGFDLWKILFESKVWGIIRGDVCFSNQMVLSLHDVRSKIGFPLCSDFANLNNYEEFGFTSQEWPEHLNKKQDETLETWRDMLYQQMRIPVVLAALSDLKLPYVEIVSPFLSRKIIYQSRMLPEHLRAGKVLFKELARQNDISGIEYARFNTYMDRENILKLKSTVEFLRDELNSLYSASVIPESFLKFVLKNMEVIGENKSANVKPARSIIKSFTPLWLRNKLKNKFYEIKKPVLDFNTLAFRCYIIGKINKLFNEDLKNI